MDLVTMNRAQEEDHRNYGTIRVFNSERIPGDAIVECIRSQGIRTVGAMNTQPKLFAGANGIRLDVSYGVIDKSILKAIDGADTAIITNPCMIEPVITRVDAFTTESGRKIMIKLHR